jgi:hypothetical protein
VAPALDTNVNNATGASGRSVKLIVNSVKNGWDSVKNRIIVNARAPLFFTLRSNFAGNG